MSDSNRLYIPKTDLPAAKPHRFGLRSVAEFTQRSDERWQNGIEWDETCGSGVNQAYVYCDPNVPEDFVKEAYDRGYGSADAFALYAMLECGLVGGQDTANETTAELTAGEDRAVERAFATGVFATATDIVPAGAVSVKAAVASLLGAWTSGIEAVLHISPNVAPFLDLVKAGNHLELSSGERVSVGYGYAEGFGGTTFDDYAMFLTGPAWAWYGTAIQAQAPTIVDNDQTALTERAWLVAALCEPIRISIDGLLE